MPAARRLEHGWVLWTLGALLAAAPAPAQAAADPVAPGAVAQGDGWWTKGDLIDYGIIAAAAGVYFGVHALAPPEVSGIGPDFDPNKPSAILAATYSDRLGRRHLDEDTGETVPTARVGVAIPVVAAWLVLQEGLPGWIGGKPGTARRVHDTAVGFTEAVALTLAGTEALKYGFGRLRPDFQDRVRRHYCNLDDKQGVDCAGFAGAPLADEAKDADKVLADGRRSFPSGHASTSFALATYASLVTGGHFVWGESATPTSRAVGVLLQTTVMATAVFVAGSRIDDGRHHASDVLTGAAVGFGLANLAYWRRFGVDGQPLRARQAGAVGLRDIEVAPGPSPLGVSLGLRW